MTLLDYKVYQSDLDSDADLTAYVGNTPLLPLRRISRKLSPRVKVFAKAEWFNPGGSVKDRPALNILQTARIDVLREARDRVAACDMDVGSPDERTTGEALEFLSK